MSHLPRRSKRTLNLVTAVYVVVGFCVMVPAAATGNRLNAFLGFLIISGALAAAAVIAPVLRVVARLASIDSHLRDLRLRLRRIEAADAERDERAASAPVERTVDLASFGLGDPSVLTAATLERDVFPRLMTTMDESPPAIAAPAERTVDIDDPAKTNGEISHAENEVAELMSGVTSLSLLRQWKVGLRNDDLASCRSVYSAMVDLVDSATLKSLRTPLEQLADRVEATLRQRFAEHARQRDFAALAKLGEEILRLLPDRPIAEEFRRFAPRLRERLSEAQIGEMDAYSPVDESSRVRESATLR